MGPGSVVRVWFGRDDDSATRVNGMGGQQRLMRAVMTTAEEEGGAFAHHRWRLMEVANKLKLSSVAGNNLTYGLGFPGA